jgi:hypothetical protein
VPEPILKHAQELERENAALRKAKEMVELERCEMMRSMSLAQNQSQQLRADKARLDWILTDDGGHWVNWMYEKEEWTPELKASRDAIDACLKPSTWKEAQP